MFWKRSTDWVSGADRIACVNSFLFDASQRLRNNRGANAQVESEDHRHSFKVSDLIRYLIFQGTYQAIDRNN